KRNFIKATPYSNDYIYGTRFTLLDHNNVENDDDLKAADDELAALDNPPVIFAHKGIGSFELVIGPSWEENQLMLAEALIRTGNAEGGLALIDEVRTALGSGVDTGAIDEVAGAGLTPEEAMTELTMERRVALLYRGLSFYDNRRWGWTY